MQIIKKSDFKSKIEFILEYLDHHKIIFEKEIFIYPENDEKVTLKLEKKRNYFNLASLYFTTLDNEITLFHNNDDTLCAYCICY